MDDEQLELKGVPAQEGGEGDGGGEAHAATLALENEALEQGWVPKNEWRGNPDEWTDAETFVRRGREINPILRKALDREKKERQRLEKELTAMRGTVSELAAHRADVEKRIYDRALADLKAQRKEAFASGDSDRLEQVEDAIEELKADPPKPAAKEVTVPTQPQAVIDWMEANSDWYGKDEDMTDYANGITARLVQSARGAGNNPDPDTILAEVSKRVATKFPKKAASPAMFDSGGSAPSPTSSKKGFGSLPPEAKSQFKRFYDAGYYPGKKLEDAQAQYFADY